MTRIIAGSANGRRLRTPPGTATRPTADRVREALFSSLESELGSLAGRRFLDLYAGSGAVGLEARSRGAAYCLLVERDRATVAVIRRNLVDLGFTAVDIRAGNVEALAQHPPGGAPFDVAFLDPPYSLDREVLRSVLTRLADQAWLAGGATVVVERGRRDNWTWPDGFEATRSRKYADTMLWYSHWAGPPAGR